MKQFSNKAMSLLDKDFSYKLKSVTEKGSVFDYAGEKTIRNLKLNLLGEFQIENAALAIRAIELISNFKFQISNSDLRKGLKEAFIPGRLEIIKKDPLVISDGAHNLDKMNALVASLKSIFPKRKVKAIVAIKYDKNAVEIIRILLPICQEITFTGYEIKTDQGVIKSYEPRELEIILKRIDQDIPVSVVSDPKDALIKAEKDASETDLILITGSLYLVGR